MQLAKIHISLDYSKVHTGTSPLYKDANYMPHKAK